MTSLAERMLKSSATKAAVLSESTVFEPKDAVDFNVPILNIANSAKWDGGFMPGISLYAGESKTFKTAMCLLAMSAYLKKYDDAIGILYDNEFGITTDYIRSFDIDPERVIHIPFENIEILKFDMVKKLEEIKEGDHVFFMIDSIGLASSKKEVEDAKDEKSVADMTRAKALRSFFRMITMPLNIKKLPCFMINHIYMSQGTMYPQVVIPGGCLQAGTEITLADGSTKSVEQMKVGDMVATLEGPKAVTHVWDPETLMDGTPECYEVEFEDGTKVVCSDGHPFLTTTGWVPAKTLLIGENVVCLE